MVTPDRLDLKQETDSGAKLLASMQNNTSKQIQEIKDILLKTSERKKEILLSAGAPNLNNSPEEKDISGFNEGA